MKILMPLPPGFSSTTEYFRCTLEFLKEYQWIFNYPNTHILVYQVFDKLPQEWLPYLRNLSEENLNKLPSGDLTKDSPRSLNIFFDKLKRLNPVILKRGFPSQGSYNLNEKRVSEKKRHEISLLAPLIERLCRENNINLIIDLGSGRGYLTQQLYALFNCKVLGVEGCKDKVFLAESYQTKYFPESKDNVKYVQHFITPDTPSALEEIINSSFPQHDRRACIVGLHACADLSIDAMDLFITIPYVKALAIMPCCYHRLKTENGRFVNFPLSNLLKEQSDELEANCVLRTPFLRLACQEKASAFVKKSPEEHLRHSKLSLFRAIVQMVAEDMNCTVSRLKRKSGKHLLHKDVTEEKCNNDVAEFEAYVQNLQETHVLIKRVTSKEDLSAQTDLREVDDGLFRENMWSYWQCHKEDKNLVEALSGLQAAIQSLCENLVLVDRVEYLKGRINLEYCTVEQVTDDAKSPRCYALVAVKS